MVPVVWRESVRTWGTLSVGDDDDIDRSFLRSQFETELRKRREDVGQVRPLGRKAQDELVSGFCVGLVFHGTVEVPCQVGSFCLYGCFSLPQQLGV